MFRVGGEFVEARVSRLGAQPFSCKLLLRFRLCKQRGLGLRGG